MKRVSGEPGGRPVRAGLFEVGPGTPPEVTLIGSRCEMCGQACFPAMGTCPRCHGSSQGGVRLSRTGELMTFTIVRQGLPGYRVPYAVGLLRLPEGVRLYAHLSTVDQTELKIGMRMRIRPSVIRTDAAGGQVLGYCFEPWEAGE